MYICKCNIISYPSRNYNHLFNRRFRSRACQSCDRVNSLKISGKRQTHKLVDSKQVSGPFQQSDKKIFLLDTYARIAAINNKRCPKRLRELAKPKKQYNERNAMNYDLNYYHTTKPYASETNRSLKESKK